MATGCGVAKAIERRGGDRERRVLAAADDHALPQTAAELAGAARIRTVFLRPENERRFVLGDLDRNDADAAGKCGGIETVLPRARTGAAEADVEHVESR